MDRDLEYYFGAKDADRQTTFLPKEADIQSNLESWRKRKRSEAFSVVKYTKPINKD